MNKIACEKGDVWNFFQNCMYNSFFLLNFFVRRCACGGWCLGIFLRKNYGWIDTKVSIRHAQHMCPNESVFQVSPDLLVLALACLTRQKCMIFVNSVQKNSWKNATNDSFHKLLFIFRFYLIVDFSLRSLNNLFRFQQMYYKEFLRILNLI